MTSQFCNAFLNLQNIIFFYLYDQKLQSNLILHIFSDGKLKKKISEQKYGAFNIVC